MEMRAFLIGPVGVGKSSIALSFQRDERTTVADPSFGEQIVRVLCIDRELVEVTLVDTNSSETMSLLLSSGMRVDIGVGVFSLHDPRSFSEMTNMVNALRDSGLAPTRWIIFGTMKDLPQLTDQHEINEYAGTLNAQYYAISLVENCDSTDVTTAVLDSIYSFMSQKTPPRPINSMCTYL